MPDTRMPAEVFYAYVPEDRRWLVKLEKHLSLLKHQKLISTWHPGLLAAGAEVAPDIARHLNSAAIILLLISPDFLASDACYDDTLQHALERHKVNEARVIPVLLRPVADWQSAPFAHLLSLPTDGKFISTWNNQDVAFADVAAGIRRALEDVSLLPLWQQMLTCWIKPLKRYAPTHCLGAIPRRTRSLCIGWSKPFSTTLCLSKSASSGCSAR